MIWKTLLLIPACGLLLQNGLVSALVLSLVLLTLTGVLFAIISVIWGHLVLSSPHKATVGSEQFFKIIEQFRIKLMHNYDNPQQTKTAQNSPPILGKTVDSLLKQVVDFLVRDYIYFYLKDNSYEPEILCDNIKEDIWGATQLLHDRLTRIDRSKLIAIDIVNKITAHFEKVREAQLAVRNTYSAPVLSILPYVNDSDKEKQFLRSLTEVLMMFLLPRSYSLSPNKYFIREVLVCKVFLPTINRITDPDFINQNIITYIETQNIVSNVHVKAFEYAKSFEDFLKIINSTKDIDALLLIRYNIVNKLMQATTQQNLNRAKGVDLDNEKITTVGINKSEIHAAKKLKKYITQLTYAKKECEKQLDKLGWELGHQSNDDKKKVLPLMAILEHVLGRKYLSQFLELLASQDLIRFWLAVEELRLAQRKNWHQIGAEIFYTHIRNPITEIKVDKATRKRMEAFLLGDKGPEVFYEVQEQVVRIIEDKYYQPFLISDYYKELILAMEKEVSAEADSGSLDNSISADSLSPEVCLNVGDHSNYSRRKLTQLQEKCNNKSQALQALRSSLKPDSKVLHILEKEVEWLQGERMQLEKHLDTTEVWGENLGKWRALVQSAEAIEDKESPVFVIVVHMMEDDTVEGNESISTGWVVSRSLSQFQELHRKLRPLCAEIRNLELPSNTFKFLFSKSDRLTLERAKIQIQRYLDFVLKDDKLNQSEAIYSFLSPSSDHLKHSIPSPKKSRFSFATLFKSSSEQSRDSVSLLASSQEDDLSQCLEPSTSCDVPDTAIKLNGTKYFDDTIAEPLYQLLEELFDMRGFFKYLRKTLIGFVQMTYGRNINRQIHETIAWWFSEQMLHGYVTLFLKSFWPGGTLAPENPARAPEEKLETADKAMRLFVGNVPELLTTLVGNAAAKRGAIKVFSLLQEKQMNKQLFYEILELTMDATFPELK